MVRRWKPREEDRTDADLVRRKKELAKKLADAVAAGDEEAFVAAVKTFKPEIGKDELTTRIMQFRDAVRASRGLC
jgi:hypothetical protein